MADTTVVAPFKRPSDVDVVMDVVHPKPIVGLGNLLILNFVDPAQVSAGGKSGGAGVVPAQKASDKLTEDELLDGLIMRKTDTATGAVYREYKDIDAVAKNGFDEETDVYKKASAYFAQDNHSDRVAVLDLPKEKMRDALEAFWYFNWTFAVLSKPLDDFSTLKDLSSIFEANKDHFLVIQKATTSDYVQLQGQNYTIGLKHDLAEPMDAAFVGAIAMLPIGATTWKFKTLRGISPEVLTSSELAAITKVNAIGYETVFGKDQTTEGKALSGEYIDTLHGIMWVKNEMQTELEKLLQNNNKIPYEQRGINMILSVATQVLIRAHEKGIILTKPDGKPDYTINAGGRETQSAQNLSDRHYDGLSFTYHASGAIHTITVHGTVNSDTILNATN